LTGEIAGKSIGKHMLRSGFANKLARRFGSYSHARYPVLAIALVAMSAMTVPSFKGIVATWLGVCLWLCYCFFAFEWLSRLWIAGRDERKRSYIFSAAGIVDAIAVLPIPIALTFGMPAPTAWLLAALWILKLAPDIPGLRQLRRVLVLEAKPLASVLFVFLALLFLAGVSMHLLERSGQPDTFGSLPSALWWAVVTLTTTGYGDAVPQTPLGRLIAGMVMVCGVGVFGLLTGILATGFANESRRHNFIQTWDLVSGVPFFRCLDPAGIAEITHMLRRWEIPEATVVFRRGKVADCMYFIASGEVCIELPKKDIHLGTGAFFGEMALLGNSTRSANVVTTLPTTLLVLDLADFRTLTAHHPALTSAVQEEAARRAQENQT
jgi:voltage-gated potassium channel